MNVDFIYIPEKLCRACLQTPNEVINIFDKESESVNVITNKILQCTSVKVEEADNLPTNICKNCLDKLNTAYDFKIMFLQSNKKLRTILDREKVGNSSKIDEDFIKKEVFIELPENNNEKIENSDKENLESEVINTEVHIKEENDSLDENDSCGDVDDIQELPIKEANTKETKDVTVEIDDSAIKSMNIGDYEKLKTTLSRSEKKRTTLFCKTCNRSFAFHYYFYVHLPRHIGQVPFKCEVCGKGFPKQYTLNKHMLSHNNTRFPCEICGQTFKFLGGLRTHKLIHTDEFPHKCHLCEKSFRQTSNLKIHLRQHKGEKPFVCEVCGKAFTDQSNLYNHKLTHNVVNEFACSTCGKTFKTKKSVKSHMTTHSDLKPHACTYCGKKFNSKNVLNDHISIHTGAKPYACKICGKTFRQNSCIRRHMRVHTGETPYVCEMCPAAFKYSHHLVNHMKTHNTN